jgi:hypothetical protein
MPSMRSNGGLSAKNLGLFKVLAVPEKYAVVLALSDYYKGVHPVFHSGCYTYIRIVFRKGFMLDGLLGLPF